MNIGEIRNIIKDLPDETPIEIVTMCNGELKSVKCDAFYNIELKKLSLTPEKIKIKGKRSKYIVIAHFLNVRSKPSTEHGTIIDNLYMDDIVTCYDRIGKWIKIDKNYDRWVSSKFLRKIKDDNSSIIRPTYTVTAYYLNVRNKPSTNNSTIIDILNMDDKVIEYDRIGKWVKIDKDRERWVSSRFLAKDM